MLTHALSLLLALLSADESGNLPPVAKISAYKTAGLEPLPLAFFSDGSFDPEGDPIEIEWLLHPGGQVIGRSPEATVTLEKAGNYIVELRVRDQRGGIGTVSLPVVAGNSPPDVQFTAPRSGDFFTPRKSFVYKLAVADLEDGNSREHADLLNERTCVKVTWKRRDGSSVTQTNAAHGLSGKIKAPGDNEIVEAVVEGVYTDLGRPPANPLTGQSVIRLRNRRLEAEFADEKKGVDVAASSVREMNPGDYLRFAAINLSDTASVTFRVAAESPEGKLEVRAGSADGALLAEAIVRSTGGLDRWSEVTAPFKPQPNRRRDLYIVFVHPGASGSMNLDWVRFNEK